MSNRVAPSPSATSWPTVLLPLPERPTRRRCRPALSARPRAGCPGRGPAAAQGGDVIVVVAPHLAQAVAAELLQHRVGQRERDHRLGDDAQRREPRSRRSARSRRRPAAGARSTVGSGDIRVEIGFIATRTTSGSPVVIPPSSPPALLLRRRNPPRGSPAPGAPRPVDRVVHRGAGPPAPPRTPRPISTALTAGIDISSPASRPSSLRSQLTWLPRPTSTPAGDDLHLAAQRIARLLGLVDPAR